MYSVVITFEVKQMNYYLDLRQIKLCAISILLFKNGHSCRSRSYSLGGIDFEQVFGITEQITGLGTNNGIAEQIVRITEQIVGITEQIVGITEQIMKFSI